MAQEFEAAKAYLKQANSEGQTLYDHLSTVLLQLTKDDVEDPVAAFEQLSVKVKRSFLQPSHLRELASNPTNEPERIAILDSCARTSALLQGPPPSLLPPIEMPVVKDEDEEEEETKKAPTQGHVPDMMTDAALLEWAGISLGKDEVYKILLSLRKLAAEQGLQSVRFFGKFLGTSRDYLVAEAKLMAPTKELKAALMETKKEASGKGANEFVYYAANSAEGAWRRLPDVLPEQIITARLMRRLLTGDLDAPVKGFPRFAWPEASYLRTQIARIAGSTSIHPKGFYTTEEVEVQGGEEDETEEVLVEDAEFEAPDVNEMGGEEAPGAWAHHRKFILKQGRCTPWVDPPKENEEEEEEAAEEEEEEEEEVPESLAGLDGDQLKGLGAGWTFRVVPKASASSVACAYSTIWPGAVAVAKGKQFANIYVGWGQKYSPTLYTPPPPPAVQSEYVSNFNPEEAEEGETDPMVEQVDVQPPKTLPDEGDNEGDEGDAEEEEEDAEEFD